MTFRCVYYIPSSRVFGLWRLLSPLLPSQRNSIVNDDSLNSILWFVAYVSSSTDRNSILPSAHRIVSAVVVVVGAVVAIVAVTIVIVVCSTTDIDLKEESKIGHDISISFRFGRKKGQGHGTGEKPNLFPFCVCVCVWVLTVKCVPVNYVHIWTGRGGLWLYEELIVLEHGCSLS